MRTSGALEHDRRAYRLENAPGHGTGHRPARPQQSPCCPGSSPHCTRRAMFRIRVPGGLRPSGGPRIRRRVRKPDTLPARENPAHDGGSGHGIDHAFGGASANKLEPGPLEGLEIPVRGSPAHPEALGESVHRSFFFGPSTKRRLTRAVSSMRPGTFSDSIPCQCGRGSPGR